MRVGQTFVHLQFLEVGVNEIAVVVFTQCALVLCNFVAGRPNNATAGNTFRNSDSVNAKRQGQSYCETDGARSEMQHSKYERDTSSLKKTASSKTPTVQGGR